MNLFIIDASVAIKWFVDEPNTEPALQILEEIRGNPTRFVIPELFFNEMLSAFCRISSDRGAIKTWLQHLEELGWERVGNGHDLLEEAVSLAIKYKLRGYDAVYVATARLMKAIWLTADEEAHKKLKTTGLSKLISG